MITNNQVPGTPKTPVRTVTSTNASELRATFSAKKRRENIYNYFSLKTKLRTSIDSQIAEINKLFKTVTSSKGFAISRANLDDVNNKLIPKLETLHNAFDIHAQRFFKIHKSAFENIALKLPLQTFTSITISSTSDIGCIENGNTLMISKRSLEILKLDPENFSKQKFSEQKVTLELSIKQYIKNGATLNNRKLIASSAITQIKHIFTSSILRDAIILDNITRNSSVSSLPELYDLEQLRKNATQRSPGYGSPLKKTKSKTFKISELQGIVSSDSDNEELQPEPNISTPAGKTDFQESKQLDSGSIIHATVLTTPQNAAQELRTNNNSMTPLSNRQAAEFISSPNPSDQPPSFARVKKNNKLRNSTSSLQTRAPAQENPYSIKKTLSNPEIRVNSSPTRVGTKNNDLSINGVSDLTHHIPVKSSVINPTAYVDSLTPLFNQYLRERGHRFSMKDRLYPENRDARRDFIRDLQNALNAYLDDHEAQPVLSVLEQGMDLFPGYKLQPLLCKIYSEFCDMHASNESLCTSYILTTQDDARFSELKNAIAALELEPRYATENNKAVLNDLKAKLQKDINQFASAHQHQPASAKEIKSFQYRCKARLNAESELLAQGARNWVYVLGNILLALATLGTALLVQASRTKISTDVCRFFFDHNRTTKQKELIENALDHIEPLSAEPSA